MLRAYISVLFITACAVLTNGQQVTRFIEQRLDHFNPQDHRTWDMRYFVNNEHYTSGGPIFIYVSGGFEIHNQYLQSGLVYDIAAEMNGYMFATEQRFYGNSRPTEDTSVGSLRYLTIEQSIADIAYFIEFIKENYYNTRFSEVILFGKGTGAALAVWTRQKYPYLVTGVLASSASINSVVNHNAMFENVGRTFRNIGGPECYERISSAFSMMHEQLMRNDSTGLQEYFRLCQPIAIGDDIYVESFFTSLALRFEEFVEYAVYPNVDEACMVINDASILNDVEAVGNWLANTYLNNLQCLDFNATGLAAKYSVEAWDTVSTIAGGRQDYYLRCSQITNFPTMYSDDSPFVGGLSTAHFVTMCQRLFGNETFDMFSVDETTRRKNAFFGGLRPNVRNVFFTNGDMDPLRSLGVTEDLNEYSPAVVIPLQSRGKDLGSINPNDYPALGDVKARSRELIIQWILESEDGEEVVPTNNL